MALIVNIDVDYFTVEDKPITFRIWTDKTKTTRQDITGWALSWMVKKKPTNADASALIEKTTTAAEITLTDPANGEARMVLDAADIADVVGGQLYWHELKRTGAGTRTVQTQGTFKLTQAVHGT